jgi:hypothetical protein
MKIVNALHQAGSKASSPDERIGYGIPDVKKALMNLIKDFSNSGASVSNCTVNLQWTSKDISSMKYEIERKVPGQTGFLKVDERYGTGDIFGKNSSYQFQDVVSGSEKGVVTYRIKQIIDTSSTGFTAAYIDTATINLQATCIDASLFDVKVFENPAKDKFTVRVTTPLASSNITIRIFSANGQLVGSLNKPKLAGTAFFENIPLVKFLKGTYYVSVYDEGKHIGTRELIKL